jgi:FMN phosphatase YigB (HAD superfamily)
LKERLHNMKNLLTKQAVISFDIFDTLLTRKFSSPSDVFIFMEKQVQFETGGVFKNFAFIRRKAESLAIAHFKSQGINEVSLDDIYNEISELTGFSHVMIQTVKALELKMEAEALCIRPAGMELYKKAVSLHKDIVLISDMYLPKEFIEQQLMRFNITHYIKLFLSSEYREKKHDGELFNIFLTESGVNPASVLHIGDNPIGDISAAKKAGLNVHFIPKAVENYKGEGTVYDCEKTRSKSLTGKLIADSFYDMGKSEMSLEKLGFTAFGPMVAGFTAWLYREAKRDGVKVLYFCARDALIFKQAFEMMYPGEIKCEYLKISRHMSRLHDLKNRSTLLNMANEAIFATTIGDYLRYRFGLEDIPQDILEKHGITGVDFRIGGKFNREILLALLLDLEPLIYQTAARKVKHYARYVKAIKLGEEKSGIVDFGYAGTSQRFLSELTGAEITGYYYQTFAKILNVIENPDLVRSYNSGFITGAGDDFISKNRFILETLICSPEDSFKHLEPEGKSRSRFNFVHFVSSHDEARKGVVSQLHDAALDFISRLKQREPNLRNFALDCVTAQTTLQNYLKDPVRPELFAGVAFEDLYGPQVPRFIFPPLTEVKTIAPSQVLWKTGLEAWLKATPTPKPLILVKSPPLAPITIDEQGRVIEPSPTFIGRILLDTEQRLIKKQVTDNKFIKYSHNRNGFFEDTQIKAAQVYYKFIGRKLG